VEKTLGRTTTGTPETPGTAAPRSKTWKDALTSGRGSLLVSSIRTFHSLKSGMGFSLILCWDKYGNAFW